MLVSDYLQFAITSEVKPLKYSDIGSDDPTDVQQSNRDALIGFLHLANIEVHKKFALIQKEFILEEVEHNKTYPIPLDWMYPINAAYEDGTEIPINNDRSVVVDDVDVQVSVLFPSPYTALTKGTDDKGRNRISLVYVATPDKLEAMNDFIDISDIYTEALLYYLAYKAYSSVQGDMQATNNTYYLRFIESCKNIVINGLSTVDNLDSNIKLDERGFV